MLNSFPHHSARAAMFPQRSVTIDGRSYPASQRNMVAASLLARPDRSRQDSGPLATWWRA